MNLSFKNETTFNQLLIKCKDNEFLINNKQLITIEMSDNPICIEVIPTNKNSVLINPLFILSGFTFTDDIITTITCRYKITLNNVLDNSTIIIKEVEARFDEKYIYQSVYCDYNNAIMNGKYNIINNKGEILCKSLHFFVTSLLPVSLFLLLWLVFTGNILTLVGVFFVTIFFSIPSWREIKKVKVYFNDNVFVNKIVNDNLNQKKNKDNISADVPKDRLGKFFYNTLDKIFKK